MSITATMVKELRGTLKELGAAVENVTWEK